MAKGPDKPSRGRGGTTIAALLLGAGVVGALWFALSRKGGFRSSPNPMRIGPPKLDPDLRRRSDLRRSILGQDKGMVQSVFGPPRAAGGLSTVPDAGRQAYWDADTWYYALDRKRHLAMAVVFEGGIAREVEFVEGHPL